MTLEERAAARVVVDASPYGVALKAALDHIDAAEARIAELTSGLKAIRECHSYTMLSVALDIADRTLRGDR